MKRSCLAVAVLLCSLGLSSAASAQGMQQVLDLNRQAMDAYTNMDIDRAKRLLEQALQMAQRQNVTGAPLARTYLNLGVVSVGGFQDNAAGIDYFTKALQSDPNIQLDPLTSTPEIQQTFSLAKARAGSGGGGGGGGGGAGGGGGGGGGGGPPPPVPSGGAGTIPHQPVQEQLSQTAVPVFVEVPGDAPVGQMYVYYKGHGMRDFRRLEMQRMSNGFGVEIPCSDVYAPKMQYYIVAFGEDGSPLGFAGTKEDPVEVPIVSERTQPPPALPGQVPPEQCGMNECPPGMPGCNSGGGAGMGDTCTTSADCREGLTCDDNFCVSGDGDGDGGPSGDAPRFFAQLGFAAGLGYASSGMDADAPPPEGASMAQRQAWVRPGTDQACEAGEEGCNVRVEQSGFLFAPALRIHIGYYIIERLALAAMIRWQFNSGKGTLASTMIGLRGQFLITEPSSEGFNAAVHLGTAFGQIQLQPDQAGAEEPYIISGLNSVQIGGTVGWRFMRNFGIFVSPEVHLLFPTFMFAADITIGPEITF